MSRLFGTSPKLHEIISGADSWTDLRNTLMRVTFNSTPIEKQPCGKNKSKLSVSPETNL